MRDLFDDFMDELRRREAEARGEDPDAVAPRRRRPSEPAPEPDGDGDGDGDGADDHDPDGDGPDEADASGSGGQPPRPIRGRKPGGPNDGGGFGSRVRRAGRALGIGLAALILLALIALFAFGIEIWTDALWFQSVGYSDVYWTRIAAQVGLFVFGLVLALIVLLGNLWLAGRLTPPPIPGGGTVRNLFDRLNEAAEAAEVRRTGGARRWSPPDDRRSARVAWNADDIPDLSPIATWVLAGLVVLFALGVAGSLATAWETVLLWQNRVPFSETASVTDPIFGRDISLLPVRAAVPAARAGAVQRPRPRGAAPRVRALPGRGDARRRRSSRRGSGSTWPSSVGSSCCPSRSATSSTSSSSSTAPEPASRRAPSTSSASASPTRTPSSSPTTC